MKKKSSHSLTQMAESAWNRFVQTAGDPGAPQLKLIFDGKDFKWQPWPLEWDLSKIVDLYGDKLPTYIVARSNDFWCPGATLVTALDSFTIMNSTSPAETGKTWISTKLSKAITEV